MPTYNANPSERVTIDPDDARGPWTITLPTTGRNGDNVTIKSTTRGRTPVAVTALGPGVQIEDPTNLGTLVSGATGFSHIFPHVESLTWVFNLGRNAWFIYMGTNIQGMRWVDDWVAGTYQENEVARHRGDSYIARTTTTTEPGTFDGIGNWDPLSSKWLEVWQAVAAPGLANTTVQWTFLPLFTGQTPILTQHAGGVLTFQNTTEATMDFQLSAYLTYQIAANNQAVEYTLLPTFVGAGVNTLLGVRGSMGSPRLGPFVTSTMTLGKAIVNLGDTLSWVGNATGDGASTVDLDGAFLQIAGPPSTV